MWMDTLSDTQVLVQHYEAHAGGPSSKGSESSTCGGAIDAPEPVNEGTELNGFSYSCGFLQNHRASNMGLKHAHHQEAAIDPAPIELQVDQEIHDAEPEGQEEDKGALFSSQDLIASEVRGMDARRTTSEFPSRSHSRSPASSYNLAEEHLQARRTSDTSWRGAMVNPGEDVEEGMQELDPGQPEPQLTLSPQQQEQEQQQQQQQQQYHHYLQQQQHHHHHSHSHLNHQEAQRESSSVSAAVASVAFGHPTPSHPLVSVEPSDTLSSRPNNHPSQYRSTGGGQYKGLGALPLRRRIKSSLSLDSLRSSFSPTQANQLYSSIAPSPTPDFPNESITTIGNTSLPTTASIRDQQSSKPSSILTASTRSGGVEKKAHNRLRRRPSAQLLSSTLVLDRLKLDDPMATRQAHESQHIKYELDSMTYPSSQLPLSPPPSVTRQTFMDTNSSSDPYSSVADSNVYGLIRPSSMSSLRGSRSFSEFIPEDNCVRRSSDPNSGLESVSEMTPFLLRQPWNSSAWLSPDMPQTLSSSMEISSPGQSPGGGQTWVEDDEEMSSTSLQLPMSSHDGMPVMVSNMAHSNGGQIRLAMPPAGRGMHRMPSCPTFRETSVNYHMQQAYSPAVEHNNLQSYMERSHSNNSSVPSPPDSPNYFYGTERQQFHEHIHDYPSATEMGRIGAQGFTQDAYTSLSDQLPVTPNSRRPSQGTNWTATNAAAAALAATKTSKAAKRPSARRVKSASNTRALRNEHMLSSSANTKGTTSAEANLSFVNFTPLDARKILSGVAPSGSSKTKARREREAAEKRRKLSEAAAAAILRAGGNIDEVSELSLHLI